MENYFSVRTGVNILHISSEGDTTVYSVYMPKYLIYFVLQLLKGITELTSPPYTEKEGGHLSSDLFFSEF